MIAIIPAIGDGRPELRIADRSVLDWIIDEGFASGANRVIVVTSRGSGEVEQIVASRTDLVDLAFQDKFGGLGGAIASAGVVNEDALILLPSILFAVPPQPVLSSSSLRGCDGAVLVRPISEDLLRECMLVESNSNTVTKVLERPHLTETEYRVAAAGRFLLSDRFMRLLHDEAANPIHSGRLDLAPVLNRGLLHRLELSTVQLPSEVSIYDLNSPEGFPAAVGQFGV